jgi:hypothetical protein
MLTVDSIPTYILERLKPAVKAMPSFQPRKLDDVIREHVIRTLGYFGHDREKAARELGISPAEIDRMTAGSG